MSPKHCAVAIRDGDGRYVFDRDTGAVTIERGPQMLLLDPRQNAFVRRTLSDRECKLLFPGNEEVLHYNTQLRQIAAESTARPGVITDAEFAQSRKVESSQAASNVVRSRRTKPPAGASFSAAIESLDAGAGPALEALGPQDPQAQGTSGHHPVDRGGVKRGTTYHSPRMLTFDSSKFDGAIRIKVWDGYAVKVVPPSTRNPSRRPGIQLRREPVPPRHG
jgi:hypothetical protein